MEFGDFAYKSNSVNIAYYTEKEGPHWVSVLETGFDITGDERKLIRRDISTYHFSVYRDGEGIVKEFDYTPDPRKVDGKDFTIHGNLDPVIVTNLMRRKFGA
jgi:hypothetical protein